jgi:hypothetical protein
MNVIPSTNGLSMRLLARTLALCSAVVLALPPGWCCYALNAALAASAAADEVTPPVHACCRTPAAPHENAPTPAPAKPKASCCCQQDAAQPKSVDTAADALPAVAILPAAAPAAIRSMSNRAEDNVSPGASPSLRLLHCVWLC